MMAEDNRVAHGGMGEAAGRCLGVFCADDRIVGSRGSNWLQHLMNVFIRRFRWYGLAASTNKSHTVTCLPGALMSGMSEEAK